MNFGFLPPGHVLNTGKSLNGQERYDSTSLELLEINEVVSGALSTVLPVSIARLIGDNFIDGRFILSLRRELRVECNESQKQNQYRPEFITTIKHNEF